MRLGWIVCILFGFSAGLPAAVAPRAIAQVQSLSQAASLSVPAAHTPAALLAGDFSIFAWVRRDPADAAEARVLTLPGTFDLGFNGSKGVEFRLWRKDGRVLTARTGRESDRGLWTLIVVSFTQATGSVLVWAGSGVGPGHAGHAVDPFWAGPVLRAPTAGLRLGAADGSPAMLGSFGVITIRDEPTTDAQAQAAFASRRAFAGYASDTQTALAPGASRCVLMLNHSVLTNPLSFLPDQLSSPALAGEPVTLDNYALFRGELLGADHGTGLVAIHGIDAAEGFVFSAPSLADNFFLRDLPRLVEDDFTPYAGVAPTTRLLATNAPDRTIRVMVTGNSRAVQRDDGTGDAPGNWMHGFAHALGDSVSGSMLRPMISEGGEGHAWLGFDARGGVYRTGLVEPLDWPGDWLGFTRFWSGSAFGDGVAAGSGVRIAPGISYALRTSDEPGTKLRADATLRLDAFVLRFPGSSTLRWRTARATTSAAAPVSPSTWTVIELDSTDIVEVLAPGAVPTPSELVTSLAAAASIAPGHACYVSAGAGAGAIAIVGAVDVGPTEATVALTHPLDPVPEPGSTVRFGPWSVERVTTLAPPVPTGDPAAWRGLELQAQADTGAGVIAFAVSAARDDIPGFILGPGGWGGHGYDEQIAGAAPGALHAWAAASAADIWMLTPAQQASDPESMSAMTDIVRAARPDAEIVWAHDMEHDFGNPLIAWHRYVRDHGQQADAAISILYDPAFGSWPEQLRSMLRKNGGHMNTPGAKLAAERWIDALRRATASPCPADFDGSGIVNSNDFFAFLAAYGAAAVAADLTGDGTVNVNDFFAFLAAYQAAC